MARVVMAMASRHDAKYWADRAVAREAEAHQTAAELTTRLYQQYEQAAVEIRRRISDFYARYAGENGLTYEDAVRLLGRREMQEWRATVGQWVQRINTETDPEIKAALKAEMDALSYNSQITRLEALHSQIQAQLNELYDTGVHQMEELFGDLFERSYYHKHFDLQQRAGYLQEIAKIDPQMMRDILSYPWSGANFSQRLWQNMRALQFNVRQILTQGMIQGQSIAAMSKRLSDSMGKSYKQAETLIRTETTNIHAEADRRAYDAAGVKEYEYMATLDNRTSEICASLDGQHFKVADAKTGVNYPPMHPNCRSTTVEYDPEDALDWYNSGKKMPHNMTYEEWAEWQDHQRHTGENLDPINKHTPKETRGIANQAKVDILDHRELAAVSRYVSGDYYTTNAKLRAGLAVTAEEQEAISALDAAVKKLPIYQGQVFRSIRFNSRDELLNFATQTRVGGTVIYNAYTSASTLDGYHDVPHALLRIRSKTGRDLRQYNAKEGEVLFARDTSFAVKRVYLDDKKIIIAEMEEI